MRQALHIFRKDVRRLRREIALFAVTVGVFASSEMRIRDLEPNSVIRIVNPAAMLLVVALAIALTGRVVHSEALDGDRQFWLTRPYWWKSLLCAKCLFLGAFVLAPLMVSDVVLMKHGGFAVTDYLPGFAWEQVLRIAVIGAPAMALAAVTRNAASQIFTVLGLGIAYSLLGAFVFPTAKDAWDPVNWVGSLVATSVALTGLAIVTWQYGWRRTGPARIALGGIGFVLTLTPFFPTQVAMAIQTRGEQQVVDPAAVSIEVDPSTPIERTPLGFLRVPLRISGVPEGYRLWADQIHLKIRSATQDGDISLGGDRSGMNGFWLALDHSHAILELRVGSHHETMLRGSAFFTVGKELQVTARPTQVPFRGLRLIEATPLDAYLPSYSPLPAELRLDPVQNSNFLQGWPLTVEQPVQHFFANFKLEDVRLDQAVPTESKDGTP